MSLLSRMPLEFGWRTHIAAPLFHTWGFAHFALAMLLGSTVVLRRRFDPEDVLRVVEENRCESLVVIPVMLQRILSLDEDVLAGHSMPTLKVVAVVGLGAAGRAGDSTGWTASATTSTTSTAPPRWPGRPSPRPRTCARRPPRPASRRTTPSCGSSTTPTSRCPTGGTGRIFVGNSLLFEGYTGGGSKDMIDGLMSSGDVGRFDEDGRLYVEGRDDEMIVSGGENVFPKEVEDCLVGHDAVVEAAAIGVEDADFGTRLRAFVVGRVPRSPRTSSRST